LDVLKGNVPSTRIRDDVAAFSLLFMCRKLMFEHKTAINRRIVVVGASDTGLSCLETLIYSAHLRFNNVTLVSAHGLPLNDEKPLINSLLPSSMAYTGKDLKKMALSTWSAAYACVRRPYFVQGECGC
jgi:hypothetical protein